MTNSKEKELEQREKALEAREKKLEQRERELGFFSQAVREKKESWYDHIHVRAACDRDYPDHPGSYRHIQVIIMDCAYEASDPCAQFIFMKTPHDVLHSGQINVQ